MLLIAIANGAARDLWYKKYIGELKAHQVSTVSFIIFLAVYIGFVINLFPPRSAIKAIFIGASWVILTLSFEFGFGILRGQTIKHLMKDYNIFEGRIWVLIPVWVLVAPYIFYKVYA